MKKTEKAGVAEGEAPAPEGEAPEGRKAAAPLEVLLKECEETKANWGLVQNDIVFAVAYWAMIECGFESLGRKVVKDKSRFTLPENWKHQTRQVYEAQFVLPPYVENPVKMVALPAEDILCVNVIASNLSPRNVSLRSLAIHSSGYVPRPEENTFTCKFSGLNDFHVLLRNSIIWPIRCSILTDRGVMNPSLNGLSDEIKLKIIRHLTIREILTLSQTCHDLNRICNDQGLWKTIFHDKFKGKCKCSKDSKECDDSTDWKHNFKEVYSLVKNTAAAEGSPSESYHSSPEFPFGSEIEFNID